MNSRPGVEGRTLKGAGIYLGGPTGAGKGKSGPSGMGLGLGGVRRHRYVVLLSLSPESNTEITARNGLMRWEDWSSLDRKETIEE